ncbi:unnamed protein product [Auanema sp. JU1783]|nr:unnamed protein product [Auanema sp. JU1783]
MRRLVLLFALIGAVHSVVSQDIYHKIAVQTGSACYRLLNGTHQFGCHTTKQDGSGVVIVLKTDEDVSKIKTCWRDRFPEYDGSFYIMIDLFLFDRTTIEVLRRTDCVKGIILTKKEDLPIDSQVHNSHDSICPNEQTSFYKDGCEKNVWNEAAVIPQGLRYLDWDKQILFLSNSTDIASIEKCYDLFNKPNDSSTTSFPLCAVSFSLRNMAAGSSEICYRRSQPNSRVLDLNIDDRSGLCHSLSGRSIVALLPPNKRTIEQNQSNSHYLLLAARLDSFGLIPEVSFGDISVVTSLITMLAIAKGIGDNYESFESASSNSNKYLLYSLFNGEAFDYIGSSHMFFDIENNRFPHDDDKNALFEQVSPESIVAVIEPQHMGSGHELNIIADSNQLKSEMVKTIVKSLRRGARARNTTINPPVQNSRMPPSSWHPLKKINPKAVGVVLAPFTTGYQYSRINSMLDTNTWTKEQTHSAMEQIAVAASSILRAAADFVGLNESAKSSLTVDDNFISTIFNCFVPFNNTFNCQFLDTLRGNKFITNFNIKSTYIGVGDANILQTFSHSLLMYASGTTAHTRNVKDAKQCSDLARVQKFYNFQWMTDPLTDTGHCYRHSVYLDEAISPAFLIEGYDFKNSTYSTWTESVYELDDLRLFLVQKKSFEMYLFITGCIITFLSIIIAGRCTEDTFIIDEGDLRAEQGEPL